MNQQKSSRKVNRKIRENKLKEKTTVKQWKREK